MQDFLPLPSCDLDEKSASELPTNQNTDVAENFFEFSKKITVKHGINQTSEDSRINDDVDNDVIHAESCDSVAVCCNEIENTSTKVEWAESAEEKEKHSNSYSFGVLFVDRDEITETWDLDVPKIDTMVEQGHKTKQQDNEFKLVETCVMVTRDELQSVPNAVLNLRTSKNKKRQPFLLSKKAARRQEYEELAILHGNNEKGDYAESLSPTLQDDHKKLSESEWEVL